MGNLFTKKQIERWFTECALDNKKLPKKGETLYITFPLSYEYPVVEIKKTNCKSIDGKVLYEMNMYKTIGEVK